MNTIKEKKLEDEIHDLKENFQVEKEVSTKILEFIKKRKGIIEDVSDKREKLGQTEVNKLLEARQQITQNKENQP